MPARRAGLATRLLASWLVALTILGAFTRVSHAQQLRGTVTRADGAPAAQVLVVATDVAGAIEVRSLTDTRGGFTLRLPRPDARYQLRALQVGVQPTVGPLVGPFASDSATIPPLALTLSGAVVSLPRVTVRSTDVCGTRARDGEIVANVWEEARKALLSSGLTSGDAPLQAEWVEYDRTLDNAGARVRRQSLRHTSSVTTRAFRSASAESLATYGYVVDAADGTLFHAPDADVLLSESFTTTHCFRVEPPDALHEHEIGVAFRPARRRDGASGDDRADRRDIEGVLWLDRNTSELRRLVYSYTNLPRAAASAHPGGTVDFLHLPTGEWLVQKWSIRMPVLDRRARSANAGRRRVVITSTNLELDGVQVTGGEVTHVRRGSQLLYAADGTTLEVRAQSDDARHSPANLVARLDGTDYVAEGDTRGVARFTPVLPGDYQLRVQTPLMDTLGVSTAGLPVSVSEDGRVVTVRLPQSAELLQAVCGAGATNAGASLVRGVVRDSLGAPVPLATLRLRTAREATAGDLQRTASAEDGRLRVIVNDDARTVLADSAGRWRACGVPRGQWLMLYAAGTSGTQDTLWRIDGDTPLAALDVIVRRRAEATLSLRVVDDRERPLRDVLVDIQPLGADALTLRTDPEGRAVARGVPLGSAQVRLRRLGFQEGTVTLELVEGPNEVPLLLDPIAPPSLDTVRVRADGGLNARYTEFEVRRVRGLATASITREEIERRNPVSIWQMLTRVPGVQVVDSLGYVYAKSSRDRTMLCWMRVAINGVVLADARPNLALLPPPQEIHGIEVFAGPASIPPTLMSQGSSSGPESRVFCGIVALWTR